jgi:ATP-dependent Clp protease ATP-binding subunit ClpC
MEETELTVSTVLLVEEQWGGEVLVAPIADLSLVSCGEEREALLEQEVFLAEHLAQADAPTLARFPMPPGLALESFEVLIPREDLPRRLAMETPLAIPCLKIPAGQDAWVVVLPLRATLYIAGSEPFAETVKSEILRLAAAEELSPRDYLKLLPPRRHRLERVTLTLQRDERSPQGRGAALRKALSERQRRKEAAELLETISSPWHGRSVAAAPLEGREAESKLLGALLGGEERASVLLVGPEGSGKTELLRAWFARAGRERLIYQTSGAQLVAGMSGLGQWQERIRRVFDAAERLDAVLYFDNLGDLFAERVEGSIDLAGAMKPYLEQGKVRLVGELSPELLELAETRQAGFLACLSRIKVEPLGAAATARALRARVAHDRRQQPDLPTLDDRAIEPLIDLAERYLPYRAFPGKAMKLYDELRSVHEQGGGGPGRLLTSEQIFEHFSVSTGVPAFLLREDRALHVQDVLGFLQRHLIGQQQAVQRVAETVCVIKAGLQPTGKPLATFLFVGPTGVGKTELARALATFLFGSPERLVRFDMSEYMDIEAAERLIRGTDRADGLLTRKVREQPFCVLLLDEIEKASKGVFDLLLQVFGEGRLSDARGKTAYFHNAIIILTSNLGAANHRPSAGFQAGASGGHEDHYTRQVIASFRPEFVNRLDRIIAFRPLAPSEAQQVARLTLEKICMRRGFTDSGASLAISHEALALLARGGYSERYGARALRRHLDDHLVAPCARLLASLGAAGRSSLLRVLAPGEPEADPNERIAGLDHNGLRFELLRRAARTVSKNTQEVRRISELRRDATRWLLLPRIEQVKEQLAYLLAQINYGPQNRKDRRTSLEISELQADHHRLHGDYEALVRAVQHLEVTEELALTALYSGQSVEDLQREAEVAIQQARQASVRLLLALEQPRDAVLLRLFETQGQGALSWWFTGMDPIFRARGWEATFHVLDDPMPYAGYWPRVSRRWGPPRRREEIEGWLRETPEGHPPRALILACRGPLARLLLRLEVGVHRWVLPGGDPPMLRILPVASRTALADRDWHRGELAPPTTHQQEEGRRMKPLREFDVVEGKVTVQGRAYAGKPARFIDLFDEVILDMLLPYEHSDQDRDALFTAPLDVATEEP